MPPSLPVAKHSIRVLLVDDHRLMLWGLERLIDGERPRMQVVGSAANAGDALALLERTDPEVVLLDSDLNGDDGLAIIPAILSRSTATVLVLTATREATVHDHAVLAGARGVLDKSESAETLVKAIEKVSQGEMWIDRNATGRLFIELARRQESLNRDPEKQRIASLTRKERQIVVVIAGHAAASGKQIAEHLHISEHTLRNHLTSVYSKLGVANRTALFDYASQHKVSVLAVNA